MYFLFNFLPLDIQFSKKMYLFWAFLVNESKVKVVRNVSFLDIFTKYRKI